MATLKEDLLEAADECRCSIHPKEERCASNALSHRLRLHASSVEEREARLAAAEALIRRRHGMECPTYDDATGTCQGCEVSAFLADEKR